jgi:hypothetical protein
MAKKIKEYVCYGADFAMIVIYHKHDESKKIKEMLDSIDRQQYKAKEKIIVFCDCKEPDWFKDYPDWIYKFTKIKNKAELLKFARKNIESNYYCFIDRAFALAPRDLFAITELLKNKKPVKNILMHGLYFERNEEQ